MDLTEKSKSNTGEFEEQNKPYELSEKQKKYLSWKRALDFVIAGAASIVLAPVMGALALAIKLDSPGPVLFKQKRVGKNKELFEIWKFRTMRTDTPKDMPTHMLNNPEQFITRTGCVMRKFSLDELPQLWQCVNGSLSLIGPRPALWNQYDLIEERDKYGANSITPGITGWAQINGRDELEINTKARFDGEYVARLGIGMDAKCFLGTIGSVLCHDGVVEGGTGVVHKEGQSCKGVISTEKLKKEMIMGVVVAGTAAAIGIGFIAGLGKYFHNRRRNAAVIGVAAGAAAYKRKKNEKNIMKREAQEKSEKLKILVVCQYYSPEPFRISDLCEEMVRRGHEVTVLTGVPNYPEGIIYDNYKNGKNRNEIINGVKVHRCFTIGRRTGTIFRFLNYYSYAVSSAFQVIFNRFRPENGGEYDVILVNQLSPIMMSYAGIIYKKIHHKKLVLYCLDLWPESLVAGGITRDSALYKVFHKISRQIYKSCEQILVTSKMFADYISNEFDVKKDKIEYLPQYAEGLFENLVEIAAEKNTMDLVFAGNIGEVQSVQTIIESAENLKAECTEAGKRVIFHIVGSGTDLERLKKLAAVKHLDNVIFHGRKPVTDMPEYYRAADAMLVTLNADPILSLTLPGKVQSYLAAGKPIIGAINGETQIVLEESESGFVGNAEDSEQLSKNIRKFMTLTDEGRKQLGIKARKYYEQNFARERYMDSMEKWLRKNRQ